MDFPYWSYISESPDGDGYIELLRPMVNVTVAGSVTTATFGALLDTGSDHTILPKHLADDLGIVLPPAAGKQARAFGGQHVPLHYGDATLSISDNGESIVWPATIFFYDFADDENDEPIVLGHTGFLNYFTATLDGKLGVLTLIPNDEIPTAE